MNGILKGRAGCRSAIGRSLVLWCALQLIALNVRALEPTFSTVIRIDARFEHEGIYSAQLPGGGYLLAGNLVDLTTGEGAIALCRLNEYGDTLQTLLYGSVDARWSLASLQSTTNGWMLCGTVDSLGNTFGGIWHIDSLGNLLTQGRYGFPGERLRLSALVSSHEGGWLLAGYRVETGTNRTRFHVRRLDGALQGLWSRDYAVRLGQLQDAAQLPDSSYLFTGYLLDQGDTSGSMFLLHTNAAGDSLRLNKQFGQGWASGASIWPLQDGCLLAGSTAPASVAPSDRFLVRCDLQGDTGWTRVVGGSANERILDVAVVEDDCILVVGETGAQLDVTKFDSAGSVLWSHALMAGLRERGQHVFQTAGGNYAVTGTSGIQSGSSAFYFLVMDTSGAMVINLVDAFPKPNYLHFYPNPARDRVRLAPGPVRSLVVTDLWGRIHLRADGPIDALDIARLSPGCYVVEAENAAGAHLQGKLIITQ